MGKYVLMRHPARGGKMFRLLLTPFAFVRFLLQSMRLALGQIWANKARATLTTIGIVIGVASVTAVIAAVTGLKTRVLDQFESFGTNKIYINPSWPRTGPLRNAPWRIIRFVPELFEDLLEHCPSVECFTRLCDYEDPVRRGEQGIEEVRINGIDPAWHKIENRHVIMGRPFSVIDERHCRQVCLVTPKIRDKLHLDRDCVGQLIVIGDRSFRIVGMVEERVESSMFGGGGSREEIFIPFATCWKLDENWMWVIANSRSPELSEDAQAELRFFLRKKRHLKPADPDTFRLQVIEQFVQKFRQTSMIMTAVAGGIVGISLLVGGVGIMNIMLVSVSERTREIGLRKAVGARPSAILLQFLVEAIMLCLFGGLIGVAIGQLLTLGIANIPHAEFLNKAHIPLWAVGLGFGFSALVGICFGFFPALKAAQLDPIEALRHE